MKITLSITQILHASATFDVGANVLARRASQHPLAGLVRAEAESELRPRPLMPHHGLVRGTLENWYHTTTFTIGNTPQEFNAILDFGSSSLIVPSKHTPAKRPPLPHLYDPFASSTYVPNGTVIEDTCSHRPFGLGNNSGFLSQDDFRIAGLTIKSQLFVEATSAEFHRCLFCETFDTALPLGPYNASSSNNFMSPIAQMIEQNLLDENIFSLRLSRGITDIDGQLVLGGVIDETLYDGHFTTIRVTEDTPDGEQKIYAGGQNWKVHAESLTLGNGSSINQTFITPTIALLDAACPWIALPHPLPESINEFIGAETWGPFAWVNCSRRAEFPDVTIVLEGERFVLSPFDYIFEQEYDDEPGKLYCQSAFMPAFEEENGVILLGNAFLRAFVTVWDLEGGTVSFARAKHTDNVVKRE